MALSERAMISGTNFSIIVVCRFRNLRWSFEVRCDDEMKLSREQAGPECSGLVKCGRERDSDRSEEN